MNYVQAPGRRLRGAEAARPPAGAAPPQLLPLPLLRPRRPLCGGDHAAGSSAADAGGGATASTSGPAVSRRSAGAAGLAAAAAALVPAALSLQLPAAAAARPPAVDPAITAAFTAAMAVQGDYEAMEAAWTRAVEASQGQAAALSAALSNRGTARLQAGRWGDAYADLSRALELEAARCGGARVADGASSLLLNQLGNAEGALGRWQDAMAHYKEAAEDPEMESIAGANYALAAFETGDDAEAARAARRLVRRDPEFLDARAALTAFLWAQGAPAAAEGEWEALQQGGGGVGAAIYSRERAVERVRGRWPPRATAALGAFLSLSGRGAAVGYDGARREYDFAPVQPTQTADHGQSVIKRPLAGRAGAAAGGRSGGGGAAAAAAAGEGAAGAGATPAALAAGERLAQKLSVLWAPRIPQGLRPSDLEAIEEAAAEILEYAPEAVLPGHALARLLEVLRSLANGDRSQPMVRHAFLGLKACTMLAEGNPALQLLGAGVPALLIDIIRWWERGDKMVPALAAETLSRLLISTDKPCAAAILAAPGDAVGTLLAAARAGGRVGRGGAFANEPGVVCRLMLDLLCQLTGRSPAAAARIAADRGLLQRVLRLAEDPQQPADTNQSLELLGLLVNDERPGVARAVTDLPRCCTAAAAALARCCAAGAAGRGALPRHLGPSQLADSNMRSIQCAAGMLALAVYLRGPASAPDLAALEVRQSGALPLLLRLCSHNDDGVACDAAATCYSVTCDDSPDGDAVMAIVRTPAAVPALLAALRHRGPATGARASALTGALRVLCRCVVLSDRAGEVLQRLAPSVAADVIGCVCVELAHLSTDLASFDDVEHHVAEGAGPVVAFLIAGCARPAEWGALAAAPRALALVARWYAVDASGMDARRTAAAANAPPGLPDPYFGTAAAAALYLGGRVLRGAEALVEAVLDPWLGGGAGLGAAQLPWDVAGLSGLLEAMQGMRARVVDASARRRQEGVDPSAGVGATNLGGAPEAPAVSVLARVDKTVGRLQAAVGRLEAA